MEEKERQEAEAKVDQMFLTMVYGLARKYGCEVEIDLQTRQIDLHCDSEQEQAVALELANLMEG